MALIDISTLLNARGDLWNKFRGGVIQAASNIYSEDVATPNHTNRLAWAQDVLLAGNVEKRTAEMYRLAMANVTIVSAGDASTDMDVTYVISVNIDTVAIGV